MDMDWEALFEQGMEGVEMMGGPKQVGAMLLGAYLVPKVVLPLVEAASVPKISVPVTAQESAEILNAPLYDPSKKGLPSEIPCYDPGTMHNLGTVPAMTPEEVHARVARAKEAQKEWAKSSFAQRRKLLNIFLRYILDHQELICRVAARDSGKPMVDAIFGEVLVTCEKIKWIVNNGEQYLKPEYRQAGYMMMHKVAKVEYKPVGVMGCIVPWNYPFHNVFNPLVANLFAGNAIAIKVSEHASWSTGFYGRIIEAALAAAGAPADLVQVITGYGDAGNALVTSGVSKVVFVGSTGIGKRVMETAAKDLTPVVLELGGKDPFIVCDDADLNQLLPFAMRGTFQSMGQNCTGAERFIVQAGIYDKFVDAVVKNTKQLRMGPALGGEFVDCGAICMPNHNESIQALIDDAVAKGARVLVGGKLPDEGTTGQFYPPTVVADVTPTMRLWTEEVFGPVLPIVKVQTDAEAVAVANDCPFGLGSSVFSRSQRRARAIGDQLEAGMTSLNDFAATYMSQALPFGGVKDSGFDRFAGIEGLRGCCYPKAVCEDRVPWLMKTNIPPLIQYPVSDVAFEFVASLCKLFYGFGVVDRVSAIYGIIKCFLLFALTSVGIRKVKKN